MGNLSSFLSMCITSAQARRAVRNIEKNNELRRNITYYEPSDIAAFIERAPQVGSYIISGGQAHDRSRAAGAAAACSLDQGIPGVVLHEGNSGLQSQISAATSFAGNRVIITKNMPVYDPFYNRSSQEICNLIASSTRNTSGIGAVGQQYITGISEFIQSKSIPPFCEMFVRCPYDQLFEKVDSAQNSGNLSSQKADQIRNLLMQGQTERAGVQSFFSQLACQGAGVLSTKSSRNASANVKTAVFHNSMLMIDIGSSTNDILLNLLINEVKEALAAGKRIMLILDSISVNANDVLLKVMQSLPSRCLTTLLGDDVYSMLGAENSLFHAFTGTASQCIVFSHTAGVSCTKWSEVFGYYDMDKVSRNIGSSQNYQWGYGFGSSSSVNVATEREYIVKPEELARMSPGEVYILDRNARELAHTTLR